MSDYNEPAPGRSDTPAEGKAGPPPDKPVSGRADSRLRKGVLGLLLAFSACGLVTVAALMTAGATSPQLLQNFRMEGDSMEPTLERGEYLLSSHVPYWFGEPERGDIVIMDAWNADKTFIKRIVGLPGEEIRIHYGTVYVNGEELDEPYLKGRSYEMAGSVTLDDDTYYVLGDNRRASSDSRAYGPLPADDIRGKALVVYWPREDARRIEHVRLEVDDEGD